jgi:hypothetical protein
MEEIDKNPKNEIILEGEENKKDKNTFKRIQELQKLIKIKSEIKEYCN